MMATDHTHAIRSMFDLTTPAEVGLACDYLTDEGDTDLADLLRRSIAPPLVVGEEQEMRERWQDRFRGQDVVRGLYADSYWPERHQDRTERVIVFHLPATHCTQQGRGNPAGWAAAEMYTRSPGSYTVGPIEGSPAAAVLGLAKLIQQILGKSFDHLRPGVCARKVEEVPIRLGCESRPYWWER